MLLSTWLRTSSTTSLARGCHHGRPYSSGVFLACSSVISMTRGIWIRIAASGSRYLPTQLTLADANRVCKREANTVVYDLGMTGRGSRKIASARARYDRAYAALISTIREELAAKAITVKDAADQAEWSREYITQIRDGEAGDTPPKRGTAPPPAS